MYEPKDSLVYVVSSNLVRAAQRDPVSWGWGGFQFSSSISWRIVSLRQNTPLILNPTFCLQGSPHPSVHFHYGKALFKNKWFFFLLL